MRESELENLLERLIEGAVFGDQSIVEECCDEINREIISVETFEQAGLLTPDYGLVVTSKRFKGEFQITIKRSR